jgi:AcrR family transcriptional regulator
MSCYIEHRFNIEGDAMVQTLKEDVRQRIYEAAVDEFYEKDYKTATIRDIARKAEIPTGLVYSYFKNKEDLFDAIVGPVMANINQMLEIEAAKTGEYHEDLFENLKEIIKILNLMDNHKPLIILMDKSNGDKYQNYKDIIIQRMEIHIKSVFNDRQIQQLDDLLIHIWVSSLVEGVCEIFRHYKGRKWADQTMELMIKQYCYGIDAFWH